MHRTKSKLSAPAALAFAVVLAPAAQAGTYTFFDVPGATDTVPSAISIHGDVAGTWVTTDPVNVDHGFLRSADGTITTFDIDGAEQTVVEGINNKGIVVGTYDDLQQMAHGFIRKRDGSIVTLTANPGYGLQITAVNDQGDVCGVFYDQYLDRHGFLRTADGTFTQFNVSGDKDYISSPSINDSDAIAGEVQFGDGIEHGFVRAPDGTIATADPPASQNTHVFNINRAGPIAGYYFDSQGWHGFIRDTAGNYTQFSPQPESAHINDKGVIAGTYSRLFERKPNGKITLLPPMVSSVYEVAVAGFNNRGEVAGSVLSTSTHGFIYTP
jgi:hypothetical protein